MEKRMLGNGNQSYTERQTVTNTAEDIFVEYITRKGWTCTRVGFDEKNKSVDNFFKLPKMLRNLPDFVVTKKDKIYVINVKGTPRFKEKEFEMLDHLEQTFSSISAPLRYAFCFVGEEPKFFSVDKLKVMYTCSHDQKWPDGVVYRLLDLKEVL